jgi:hypothetical protein
MIDADLAANLQGDHAKSGLFRLPQCAAIVAYRIDKRSPVLIIDSTTEHLDDAVCQPPPHQEQPLDVIPVRGFNTKVASRIEVSGSSPCLRLRRRQMDEIQFSRGSSSFWGRQGFPYRHSSEKGFPAQRNRGPSPLGRWCLSPTERGYTSLGCWLPSVENRVPLPRRRGARPSEVGLPVPPARGYHSTWGDGDPSLG